MSTSLELPKPVNELSARNRNTILENIFQVGKGRIYDDDGSVSKSNRWCGKIRGLGLQLWEAVLRHAAAERLRLT
ncbi:hypothetical protein AVEN_36129-1 [Araneus ventricosus]|uniref:Uncharacterized protein n=1 Tax=Araneus ventricosus TaxID=182803 RepID=A0A4Y2EH90_ARAVE|nr:hypothetical protein AVEN_36129-1 [Araneus ventricosus]